ncbi:unnamed protein product [Rhizophagus irregularis]|nr:unnamed protein product [Rhizophagus irregularis]
MSLKIPPTQQSTGEEYDVQDFIPKKLILVRINIISALNFGYYSHDVKISYLRNLIGSLRSQNPSQKSEDNGIERKVDFYDNIIRFCGVTRGLIMKLQAYDFDIIHRSGKKHLKNITVWTLFSNLGMINLILHFNWRMPIIIAMICISRIH